MQWMSDVDAKLAQLAAQSKSQPNTLELVEAVGVRISREGQILREDFTGKFAASFLLATETITKRVVELDEKQTELEERERKLEAQIAAHEAKVKEDLEKTEKKQLEILNSFIDALNQHHKINAATLTKQQVAVEECRRAAATTAGAAVLCTSFADDYKATSTQGKEEVHALAMRLHGDLQSFVKGIKEETSTAIMPTIERVRDLTQEEYLRRAKWIAFGAAVILVISGVLTMYAQPLPYIMRDAASWRTFQSSMPQVQADKINKVLDEVQAAQKAEEEKKNK
jgi:hypothetical protein